MTPAAIKRWRFMPAPVPCCQASGCNRRATAADDYGRRYCASCFAARAAWGLL